jgi:hypothetical protein
MFRSPHDILDLPAILRNRDKFQALIGGARHQKRKSNLTRWAAYNLFAWGCIVLLLHGCATAPPTSQTRIYMPVILGQSMRGAQ